jgi:hypothetical protein
VPSPKRKAIDPKLVRISVFITSDQRQRLDSINQRTDVPIAALVRRGVELILAQYETTTTERDR